MLMQVAFPTMQLWVPALHSLTSVQVGPVVPLLQAHVKEPTVSTHVERLAGQLWVPREHSLTLKQRWGAVTSVWLHVQPGSKLPPLLQPSPLTEFLHTLKHAHG